MSPSRESGFGDSPAGADLPRSPDNDPSATIPVDSVTPNDAVDHSMRLGTRRLRAWLLVVVAAGTLFRLALAPHPRPAFFWDSASYVDYAKTWAQTGRIEGVDTRRSPGYPAFLILVGRPLLDAAKVVTVQRILGVLS